VAVAGDLFAPYNKERADRYPFPAVVVGPPRSGKTFFRTNYGVEAGEETAVEKSELAEEAGGGPYRLVYYIPWDGAERYASGDAKRAVELIKLHFTPVEYLGVRYMPPGFVAEVVRRLEEGGEGAAVKYLEEQREAYEKFSTLLAPDKWDRVREVFKRIGYFTLREAVSFLTEVLCIAGALPVSKSVPLVSKFLDLVAAVIKVFGKNWITQWIEQGERWRGLYEDLRKVLAWRAAAALRRSEEEVEKALDALYGLDTARLEEVVKKIEEKLAKLESRVSKLEDRLRPDSAVYVEPEDLGVERRDGVLYVMGAPYVDPARHGLAQAVEEVERKVWEVVERGGVLAIVGPRGVGKSTLARAMLAEVLRRAAVRGVMDVRRLKFEDLPEVVERVGRSYVLFYDPSTPRFYELGGLEKPLEGPSPEAPGVVAELVNLTHRGGRHIASAVLVLPVDVYNALGEEVKRRITPVVLDLKSVDFLAEIMRRYSGCQLEGERLRALAEEIAKSDEGHTLIAKLVGEELGRRGCQLEKVEEMVKAAGGKALRFMLIYVNEMLRVRWRDHSGTYEDEDVAEIFSQILAARQYYSRDLGPGNAVAPPLLLERWARWRCARLFKSERCPKELPPKEVYSWLSRRHHDLVETALILAAYADLLEKADREDVRKVVGNVGEELNVWKKAKARPYTADDFLVEYGADLEREWEGATCLEKFALMLGAAVSGHPYKPVAEAAKEAGEDMRDAAGRIREGCVIDGYLLAGGELTPLTRALLLAMALEGKMPKPFASHYGMALEEAEKLVKTWRRRGGARWWELFYGLGLAVVAAREEALSRGVVEKALDVASWAVQRVMSPDAVGDILDVLSPLREHAPDMWAAMLYAAATPAVVERPELARRILKEVEWIKEWVVEDWAKAHLATAYATVLIKSADAKKLREDVCQLLGGIQDPDMRTLAEVNALLRLAERGLPPCGVDLCPGEAREGCVDSLEKAIEKKAGELLSKLAELRKKAKKGELSPELEKYLATQFLVGPPEALRRELSEAEARLYYSLAKAKLDAGGLEEAEKYYAKAAELYRELGVWENYLANSSWAARARVLRAGDLGGVVEAAQVFEMLWKEAEGRMEPTASAMYITSGALAKYLVYMAASGRMEKAIEALKEHDPLLRYKSDVRVATLYMLRLLGVGAEAPDTKELLEALEGRINPLLKPALAASLGLPPEPSDAAAQCEEAAGVHPDSSIRTTEGGGLSQLEDFAFCLRAYSAVKGDMVAFNLIHISVQERYKGRSELLSVLDRLDAGGLVQVSAPINSCGRFILLLKALDEARGAEGTERERLLELARAHALIGKYAYKETTARTLFGEVARTVEKCGGQVENCEDLKLALLKLYYSHI
jgi:tetratricopeptide (TPR) repeat protein/BMFP domain-containing protein YqiC